MLPSIVINLKTTPSTLAVAYIQKEENLLNPWLLLAVSASAVQSSKTFAV